MITRRMCRRHSTAFFLLGLATIMLVFWYRADIQHTITEMRSFGGKETKETIIKASFQKEKEAIVRASSSNGKDTKEAIVKASSRKEKEAIDSVVVKEQKIAIEKLDSSIKEKPQKETKCPLDMNVGVFSKADSIYETLALPPEKIYSLSFTYKGQPEKPVFDDSVIRLNPDRFLFPILIRGPNNQLIGFRETVYVAIRLNRTLVIPRFIKHRTDSQLDGGHTIHPAHRVDFYAVCKFISCITLGQFRKGCGNQADVVFRLRHYSKRKIADMESSSGMRLSKSATMDDKHINFLPSKPGTKAETYFGPNEKEIKKLFDSKERCAIYGNPFYNLKIKTKPGKRRLTSQAGLSTLSDVDLFSEIIRRTPAPKYIRDMADGFTKSIFGGKRYLSVHWRYDKKDWMKRCKTLDPKSERSTLCQEAAAIQPADVAQAILLKLESIRNVAGDIRVVYIAAPPSEAQFVEGITSTLNFKQVEVHHLKELRNYIGQYNEACEFLGRHLDDIESTIEMQICLKGAVFLRSTRSSWSSNVAAQRKIEQVTGTFPSKDEDILLLTNKQREQREGGHSEKKN